MYRAGPDPDCYPGTTVLRNRLGLRSQAALDAFEADATTQRLDEPLPRGRLTVSHHRAIHRHLFGDVYPWAGRFRTVRLSKGASAFCDPEHIAQEMRRLFGWLHREERLRGLDRAAFAAGAAHLLAELNAIHPFREGNGRAQTALLAILAAQAGHELALARLRPRAMLAAMIASYHGEEAALRDVIAGLIRSRP